MAWLESHIQDILHDLPCPLGPHVPLLQHAGRTPHIFLRTNTIYVQDYNVDWSLLLNVEMFLGNLAAALIIGLLSSIAWELPFAKVQKIVIQGAVRAVSGR